METLSNFIILQRRKRNIKTKFINQIPNYSNTGEIKIKGTKKKKKNQRDCDQIMTESKSIIS